MGQLKGRTLGLTETSEWGFGALCPDLCFCVNAFFQLCVTCFTELPACWASFCHAKLSSSANWEDTFGHSWLNYPSLAPTGFSLQFGCGVFFGGVVVVVVPPFTSSDANFCECMAGIHFLVFEVLALFFSALLTIIILFRFFGYLGQLRLHDTSSHLVVAPPNHTQSGTQQGLINTTWSAACKGGWTVQRTRAER